jgi:hypothetical protein
MERYKGIIEKAIGMKAPHITIPKEISRRKGENVHRTTIVRKRVTIDLSR